MEQPIDEVLRDYARPFLALGSSPAALDTAALIWDLVIDGMSAAQIVELFEELDAPWAHVVEAFVHRKQLFFADDRRYARAPHG